MKLVSISWSNSSCVGKCVVKGVVSSSCLVKRVARCVPIHIVWSNAGSNTWSTSSCACRGQTNYKLVKQIITGQISSCACPPDMLNYCWQPMPSQCLAALHLVALHVRQSARNMLHCWQSVRNMLLAADSATLSGQPALCCLVPSTLLRRTPNCAPLNTHPSVRHALRALNLPPLGVELEVHGPTATWPAPLSGACSAISLRCMGTPASARTAWAGNEAGSTPLRRGR